jgi:hypothetical protein
MLDTIKREFRVACSKRAQPVWFRISKWTILLGGAFAFSGSGYFWYWVAGLSVIGILVHILYRWRTRGWTRPWGGWDDLEAGRKL